ncbi:hypothetical protein RvY_02511-1 [Ramazzottius varieornatus]|uniref:Uncharacterized protein n=1 Tax=Ramazzottius varieornatus TaxID=947166 RepID=A0A1D1UQS0_RAMVA|nr:hypothetical protein RvY_02511-1 [Ramazzottius varieornatus]
MDGTLEYYPNLAVTSAVAKALAEFDANNADDSLTSTVWNMTLDDFVHDRPAYQAAKGSYREKCATKAKLKSQEKIPPAAPTVTVLRADSDGILRPISEYILESMDNDSEDSLPLAECMVASPAKVTLGRALDGKQRCTVMLAKDIVSSSKNEETQPENNMTPLDKSPESRMDEWIPPHRFPLVLNETWTLIHEDIMQFQLCSSRSGIPLRNFLQECTVEVAKEIEQVLSLVKSERTLAGVTLLDLA